MESAALRSAFRRLHGDTQNKVEHFVDMMASLYRRMPQKVLHARNHMSIKRHYGQLASDRCPISIYAPV